MNYIDKRNGEVKRANFIEIIKGDRRYRITEKNGEIIVNKVDFDDNKICVSPKYSNQISIK